MVMNRHTKYCSESFIKIVVFYLHKHDTHLKMKKLRQREIKCVSQDCYSLTCRTNI